MQYKITPFKVKVLYHGCILAFIGVKHDEGVQYVPQMWMNSTFINVSSAIESYLLREIIHSSCGQRLNHYNPQTGILTQFTTDKAHDEFHLFWIEQIQ